MGILFALQCFVIACKSYKQRACGQELEQRTVYGEGRNNSNEAGMNEKAFS